MRGPWRLGGACALVIAGLLRVAAAQGPAAPLPSFADLEAAGATVGDIRIVTQDVFDTADPREDYALFRLANRLHVQTRPGVIERALLFRRGERVSAHAIDETERLLRGSRWLYEVHIRPVAVHDGVVDIEVETRDTWTIDLGLNASRSGGANSSGVRLADYNILGSGMSVGIARSRTVDRSSSQIEFANERAFGTRAAVSASHASTSDGHRSTAAVVRPFYALDARWSAGVSGLDEDRVDSIYRAGAIQSQYRHTLRRAEAFGGWSPGLVDGWAHRLLLGASLEEDRFLAEPGTRAPPRLPQDAKLAGPFVGWQLVQDRYDEQLNRNLIGRPEYFALGWSANVRLGWSAPAFGATTRALRYTASASRGGHPGEADTLVATALVDGRLEDGQVRRHRTSVQAQYYRPQGRRWLFYAAVSADALTRRDVGDALLLGGDNGLRGYPLRYQSGERRALVTVEERFYTDLYPWRLFHLGGAVFGDAGRAWRGDTANPSNGGWLANVGAGLRIVSARAAFSNVLHVDLAFPLQGAADVKKVQLLVKTRASF